MKERKKNIYINIYKNKDSYAEEFLNIIEYLKLNIIIHFTSNIFYLNKESIL